MSQEARYREVLAKRFNAQGSGVADYSGGPGAGVGSEALAQAQLASASKPIEQAPEQQMEQAAQQSQSGGASAPAAPQGGSALSTIGQAGMMSGNPYLMAGGLGLQVLAQGQANKKAQEEAQRQAYNDKIKARQEAMSQIARMGIQ